MQPTSGSDSTDGEYVLREIGADELPAEVERARAERWFGFQITAPHKRASMPLLGEIEPAAAAIGSVDSVEVTGGSASSTASCITSGRPRSTTPAK